MDPITLFLHFQSISSSGLLSLRYPPIYQSFTTNFAWANFVLPIKAFKDAARKVQKNCSSPVGGVGAGNTSQLSDNAIPPVNSAAVPSLGSARGIDAYALKLGIDPGDIFLIAYLVFLCGCALVLVVFLLVGAGVEVGVLLARGEGKEVWVRRRDKWKAMSSNNSLRIVCIMHLILLRFEFLMCWA